MTFNHTPAARRDADVADRYVRPKTTPMMIASMTPAHAPSTASLRPYL